jgi:hypothetical protein
MDIDFIFFHLRACITILGKSNAQQIKAQAWTWQKNFQKTIFHAKTHSNTKNVQNCHYPHATKVRWSKKRCNIAPPNI